MEKLFHEKIRLFLGGGIAGGLAGGHFLFGGSPTGGDLVFGYTMKFFGTIILAFVSGLFTVMAHDFYKHKIKHRLFKKKKEETKQDEEKK